MPISPPDDDWMRGCRTLVTPTNVDSATTTICLIWEHPIPFLSSLRHLPAEGRMLSLRGQPSKGCTKCRSRKVKCDRTKPVCEKCIKIGHQNCTYSDQFDIILRNQTSQTAERARDKWRSRSKKVLGSSEQALRQHQKVWMEHEQTKHPMEPGTLENLVHQRFFYDWVIPIDRTSAFPSERFFDFLPELYKKAGSGSALSAAVKALAYANYSLRCKSPESVSLAISNCNMAMNLLNQAVEKPTEAFSDESLAAINVLGLYEVCASLNNVADSKSFIKRQVIAVEKTVSKV